MALPKEMHHGGLYQPMGEELQAYQQKCLGLLYDYNQTRPGESDKRQALLNTMFAEIGAHCYIEPPFHANFGGAHVHFGAGVYANFNLTLVDDTHIYVGDRTMFGPNVTIATAGHPIEPRLRKAGYQYNAAVHIGENVWFGAGAIVVPGVTIGDNTVVGAGSVVTHDLPANVVAVGDPAKVMRPINDHDREFYFKQRRIDPSLFDAE